MANESGDYCFDKGALIYIDCSHVEALTVSPDVVLEAGAPQTDWSGPYVGVHVGVVSSDWGGFVENPERRRGDIYTGGGRNGLFFWSETWDAYTLDLSDAGGSAAGYGGLVGYNYQFDTGWVVGAEGDFTLVSGGDDSAFSVDGFAVTSNEKGFTKIGSTIYGFPEPYANISTDIDWLASVRVRGGYAFGDFMPFVTAGVGWSGYSVDADSGLYFSDRGNGDTTLQQFSGSEEGVAIGPVVGGGLDYMIVPGVSIRGEGLYFMFDEQVDTADFARDDLDPQLTVQDSEIELEDVWVLRGALMVQF